MLSIKLLIINNHKCSGFELDVVFRGFKQAAVSLCFCFFYLWHVFLFWSIKALNLLIFFLLSEPRFVVCFHGNGAPGASLSERCKSPTVLCCCARHKRGDVTLRRSPSVTHLVWCLLDQTRSSQPRFCLMAERWTVDSAVLRSARFCSPPFLVFIDRNKTRVKKQDSFSLTVTKPSSISDSPSGGNKRRNSFCPVAPETTRVQSFSLL